MNEGYQQADIRLVDYQLTRIPSVGMKVRGEFTPSRPYGVVVGAAQTFGRFVENPFASILADDAGIQVLNLGFSGAGPSLFLYRPALLKLINGASFVVVQAMSGRSVSNHAFEVAENQGRLKEYASGKVIWAEDLYAKVISQSDKRKAIALRAENRAQWIRETIELLSAITVEKKCLFWFSRREPEYEEGLYDLSKYWADMPHFVNARALEEVIENSGIDLVKVVSCAGLPQKLFDKETGDPVEIWPEDRFPNVKLRFHNNYYPSPEMHAAAGQALSDWLKKPATATHKASSPMMRVDKNDEERKLLIHYHMLRDDGALIDVALSEAFGVRWMFFDPDDSRGSVDTVAAGRLEELIKSKGLRAISTHQPRIHHPAGSAEFRMVEIAMLRDPISRVFAIWNYERSFEHQGASDLLIRRMAADLDFEDFVKWGLDVGERLLFNHQVRVLGCCGKRASSLPPVDYSSLANALNAVVSNPGIGLMEYFELSVQNMNVAANHVFPGLQLRIQRKMPSVGIGGEYDVKKFLTRKTYERLLQANELDLALVEAIKSLRRF